MRRTEFGKGSKAGETGGDQQVLGTGRNQRYTGILRRERVTRG
jgi:hypothetical protein